MRRGLTISLAAHTGILVWAVAVFPDAHDPSMNAPQPIPVDVVTPSEVSKVKAGKREAKQDKPKAKQPDKPVKKAAKAKKAPPKPKRVAAPAPKPPAVSPERAEPAPKAKAKKVQPVPEKKPTKKAKAAPPPMPLRRPAKPTTASKPLKPKPAPKVAASKPAKKAEKAFDPDRIAALLDKSPDAARQAPAPQRKPDAPARGTPSGQDLKMTLSEIDALRARISQCWNPPVGGLGADAIRVKLRLQLTREGTLSERPQIMNQQGSTFFQAAADSAVRAVMLCQPYALPGTKYALWRDMILNFDPREMFGG